MIVTSLPISYKVNRPHRVMVSPYIVSLIGKMTGSQAFFPINMISLRGEEWNSVTEGVEAYNDALNLLGYIRPKDKVLSDASRALISFSQQCVRKAVSDGVCEFRSEKVSICQCGRVEILTRLVDDLAEKNQLKLVRERDDRYFCKICSSELQKKHHETLMYQQGVLDKPDVWPPTYEKTLEGIVDDLRGKTYLVSRNLSGRKYKVSIADDLCIDPDFHSSIYLRYISRVKRDTEVIVVVSARHLYQGCRAVAAANSLGSSINFRLVVHPMLDFSTGNSIFTQNTSSMEYLDRLGNARTLKLFQATMLQWSRMESRCNVGDLPILKKTAQGLLEYSDTINPVSLTGALKLLNRNQLLKVLKKVRKNKELSEREKCLIASIL